jgi:puromycin-sensitive aminopeptidase
MVVNAGGVGYFRVRYPGPHLKRLAARLGELDALERFTVLSDTWAAVVAGRTEIENFLHLAEALGEEDDPDVWTQVTGALRFLDHTVDDATRPLVAAYTRTLLSPSFARLGWEPETGEGDRTATLRAQLLAVLGTVGRDEDVRRASAERLSPALAGGPALAPDLVSAVLAVVASSGGVAEYDAFLERYRHPATPQEEARYLYSLSAFGDAALAERTFELARTEVRTQNAPFVVQQLLAHRDNGAATWGRVRDDWDGLVARFPANILPRMIDGVRLLCRDAAVADDVRGFLAAHPVPSGQRTVDQIVERLGVNQAFVARLGKVATVLTAAVDRLAPG